MELGSALFPIGRIRYIRGPGGLSKVVTGMIRGEGLPVSGAGEACLRFPCRSRWGKSLVEQVLFKSAFADLWRMF